MARVLHTWWRAATVTAVAGFLVAVVAVTPATAATKRPPCTKRAIAAGLRRGTNKTPGAHIEMFGCAGRFAWAAVDYKGFTLPSLLRAHGTRWVTVIRTEPCNKHLVPKKIYFDACVAS